MTIFVGVDEVGRGCLFGPVVSCAVVLHPEKRQILTDAGVTDSKKLSPKKRTSLAVLIKECCLNWRIGIATVAEIDRLNIHIASLLSMRRAVMNLGLEGGKDSILVLVDGEYYIPNVRLPQKPVVDGDRLYLDISAASVVAKVWRDDLIDRLAKKYPGYDLASNKGYGTPKHKEALQTLPPTRLHRKSFSGGWLR